MFTYNNAIHGSIRMIPMETLTEIHEDLHINMNVNSPESRAPNAKKKIKMLNMMCEELKKALKNAAAAQKKQYDKKHQLMSFQIEN